MLLLSLTAAAAPAMDTDQFVDFLNAYPVMPPAQIAADLAAMTSEQQALLTRYEALGASVYTRACDSSPGLTFDAAAGPQSCEALQALAAQDVEWGTAMNATRYAETQRLQLIQAMSCELGWWSGEDCQRAPLARD